MRLPLPALLTAALLTPALALGQTSMDYRPFRPGHTHTYQQMVAPPELQTVRLGTAEVRGNDSVYHFTPAYRPIRQDTLSAACPPPNGIPVFRLDLNTVFGAEMAVAPTGDCRLRFTTGRTVRLQTHGLHVAASWTFCTNPALTATVVRREERPVGTAQVLDSVVVIALSNGEQLVMSKNYGLIDAPSLQKIGSAQPEVLHLLTIPERDLGGLPNDETYDWQPGDSLYWTYTDYSFSAPGFACGSGETMTVYQARTVSAAGDSIHYAGTRYGAYTSYAAPMCPTGQPGTTVYPPRAFSEGRAVPVSGPRRGFLLGQTVPDAEYGGQVMYVNQGAYYLDGSATCVPGWRYRYGQYFGQDTCQQTLFGMLDNGSSYDFVRGFGTVRVGSVIGDGSLRWVRLRGQSCGQRPGRSVLLHTRALLPERAVQLYPNPATESARLTLITTKGGPLTLTVTDALGRLTWRRQTTIGADAEVALPTASWPRGVYLVRVQLPEGARTLRLVHE